MDKVFWGERTTPWSEVRQDTLQTFFSDPERRPFALVGQVATYLKCGLQEAENILDKLKQEGAIREVNGEEAKKRFGVAFAYERALEPAQVDSGLAGK